MSRIAVSFAFILLSISLPAQERSTARSMVVSRYGIVATSQVQASQAGAEILRRGGSAMDAAIAANAALGVTEPMMNGIGGDLFALYWDAKSSRLYGLNSSGWAPRGLTLDHFRAKHVEKMPSFGIDSVTVPGAVGGWNALHGRFGRLPWAELFQPAIFYAEQGFPIAELLHEFWKDPPQLLRQDAEGSKVYLPGGKIPAVGDIFRNPDLAKAMRLIAEQGSDAFYRGPVAQAIVNTSKTLGGTMAAEDLAEFKPEWVEPISTTYRGWKVYELPPNVQGMAALEMLNIMEVSPADPAGPSSVAELHKKIEAMKLAYADLMQYNADPRFSEVPVNGLLSKEYASQRARLIDGTRADCERSYGVPHGDTTYLAVADRDGNIVSLIQSNSGSFGSGVTVSGMGFVLQNRGALFSLDPKSPNVLAPRKRPFHTIIPAFMERGDQRIGFGIMGGFNQPLAHAQFVSNIADYGMNIQQGLENPRFTVHPRRGCNIEVEGRIKPAVLEKLSAMGHLLDIKKEYSTDMGRGNAVLHDSKTHLNYGGSDPRADGSAEPEPPAFFK